MCSQLCLSPGSRISRAGRLSCNDAGGSHSSVRGARLVRCRSGGAGRRRFGAATSSCRPRGRASAAPRRVDVLDRTHRNENRGRFTHRCRSHQRSRGNRRWPFKPFSRLQTPSPSGIRPETSTGRDRPGAPSSWPAYRPLFSRPADPTGSTGPACRPGSPG